MSEASDAINRELWDALGDEPDIAPVSKEEFNAAMRDLCTDCWRGKSIIRTYWVLRNRESLRLQAELTRQRAEIERLRAALALLLDTSAYLKDGIAPPYWASFHQAHEAARAALSHLDAQQSEDAAHG